VSKQGHKALGRTAFSVFGAIAHFERRLIAGRTKDGIAATRGKRPGRQPLYRDKAEAASKLVAAGLSPTAPLMPVLPVSAGVGQLRHCGGQTGRETPTQVIPRTLPPFEPAARRALKEIRAARMIAISHV